MRSIGYYPTDIPFDKYELFTRTADWYMRQVNDYVNYEYDNHAIDEILPRACNMLARFLQMNASEELRDVPYAIAAKLFDEDTCQDPEAREGYVDPEGEKQVLRLLDYRVSDLSYRDYDEEKGRMPIYRALVLIPDYQSYGLEKLKNLVDIAMNEDRDFYQRLEYNTLLERITMHSSIGSVVRRELMEYVLELIE